MRYFIILFLTVSLLGGCQSSSNDSSDSTNSSAIADSGGGTGATPDTSGNTTSGTTDPNVGSGGDTSGGTSGSATIDSPEVTPDSYDGIYSVAFLSQGQQTALSTFDIQQSSFKGNLTNIFNQKFEIEGNVATDGTLNFTKIESADATVMNAKGSISGNIVEGNYKLKDNDGNEREGTFAGSLENRSTERVKLKSFDGTYNIILAVTGGGFPVNVSIPVVEGEFTIKIFGLEVGGFITSDGTVVFNSSLLQGGLIHAEANIDHEDFTVSGMVKLFTETGTISGGLAEKLKETPSTPNKIIF